MRGQAPPSLMGNLFRNTEEVTAIYNRLVKSSPIRAFIRRLLLRRLISLRMFCTDACGIFSSNPRRTHSGKKDKEKEEHGLL